MQRKNFKSRKRQIGLSVIGFILCLIALSLRWSGKVFGNVGVEESIYTAFMPVSGTASAVGKGFLFEALLPSVFLGGCFWLLGNAWNREFRRPEKMIFAGFCILVLGVELFYANKMFGVSDYLRSQIQKSDFIEREYVSADEVSLIFPDKKRNLICIYLESGESSNQNIENGGLFSENYTPELTELAKKNVSFSQSDSIEGGYVAPGTSWTMGGLVAETAGIPLKVPLVSYFSLNYKESFLPGVVSLGEILEKEGYTNYFFAGSDFSFGGRKEYFTQHGSYEICDYLWAKKTGKIDEDYRVWWGYEDAKLYAFVKEKLLSLEESEEPFHISMLTVDTHTPDGYVCPQCENCYSEQYANVWACASHQLSEFIQWCQRQDFYENTTIMISGDHISMDGEFYPKEKNQGYGEGSRKVYQVFLNSAVDAVQEKNRRFTTMDMFPTVLGAMGVTIQGNRLGLGTNLFSSEETLSEKYGYQVLFEELNKSSDFYTENLLFLKEK